MVKKTFLDTGIDLGYIWFKVWRNWYLFVIAGLFLVSFAYLYIKVTPPIYKYRSSIQVGTKRTGSSRAPSEEIISMINNVDKRLVEDELGILISLDRITKALKKIKAGISYYETEYYIRTWERYANSPLVVEIDSTLPQKVGVKWYVTPISPKKYRLYAKGEDVKLYDPLKEKAIDRAPIEKYLVDKVFEFGKSYAELGFKVSIAPNFKFADFAKRGQFYFVIADINNLAKSFQKNLSVEPAAKDAFLLNMNFTGQVPAKLSDFLNALMQVYREEDLKEKNVQGRLALEHLNKEIEKAERDLEKATLRLQGYKASRRLTNIQNLALQAGSSLEQLDRELRDAQLRLSNYYDTRVVVQKSRNDLIPPANLTSLDASISPLLMALTNKVQERNTLKSRLEPTHPSFVAVDAEVKSLQVQLDNYLNARIAAVEKQVSDLRLAKADRQGKFNELPTEEVELIDLERSFNQRQQSFHQLLERKSDAEMRLASNTSDHIIIDSAKMVGDKPIWPNTFLVLAISLFFSIVIPLSYLILADFLNEKINSKEALAQATDLPLLVMLADGGKLKPGEIVLLDHPKSLISETFRLLRIKLESLLEGKRSKVVAISSTINDEGKTFCALNLAAALAVGGSKVVLVSADLYQNSLEYLNLKDLGLSSYLSRKTDIVGIIQPSPVNGLDIIASGPVVSNPADLIAQADMQELIQALTEEYDYVIIDTPPIGYVSDYLLLERYAALTLFIVRFNYTTTRLLNEINELYQNEKIENIYIVMNRVKFSSMYELRFKESKKIPIYYKKV